MPSLTSHLSLTADGVRSLQAADTDLRLAALDRFTGARAAWNAFPPSARKQMLWTIVSAARAETRAARIERIASEAAEGRRALG